MSSESRRHERYDAQFQVALAWEGGGPLECTTHNISRGGVFLWADGDTPGKGTNVEMRFNVGASGDDAIVLMGSIAHLVDGLGVGIEFAPSDAGAEHVATLLAKAGAAEGGGVV